MSGIGQRFPEFSLTGVVSNDPAKAFQPFTQDSFQGKWKVVFFWPKDFTFVCPTEIAAFGKLDKEFKARDAQVLLQLLELRREGGLADEAALGRTAEMAAIGHGHQVTQVFELDVGHGVDIWRLSRL